MGEVIDSLAVLVKDHTEQDFKGQIPAFIPRPAVRGTRNDPAERVSVFCQSRSWVTQFQRTQFAGAPCNWPDCAGNGQSVHQRREFCPASAPRKPLQSRPTVNLALQTRRLREPPD